MNVEQVIRALRDLIEESSELRYATVNREGHFAVYDVYLDSDENGDLVVVID